MSKLLKLAGTFSEIDDPARMEEAARRRKRQILERSYSQPEPENKDGSREPRYFEDFISSCRSRRYDLFIDGYNVLFREDEEIISSVEDRIFALINVVDFYMFLFE